MDINEMEKRITKLEKQQHGLVLMAKEIMDIKKEINGMTRDLQKIYDKIMKRFTDVQSQTPSYIG